MKASVLRSFVLTGVAAVLALPVLCQTTGTGAGQAAPCRLNPAAPMHLQPYTAEFKITNVQVLSDGTTITRETKEIHAKDSQGRTLTQTSSSPGGGDASAGFTSAHVQNTIDGTQVNWDSHRKKAVVIRMPVGDQKQGCWESDSGHMSMSFGSMSGATAVKSGGGAETGTVSPSVVVPAVQSVRPATEDLGVETIQGIEAHGHRMTFTTPVGKIGNDRPLVRVSETWMAPSLGLVVREVTNDPQSGKRTRELVNLTQGEPDPSLFEPPEGYEVVTDEMHKVPCDVM